MKRHSNPGVPTRVARHPSFLAEAGDASGASDDDVLSLGVPSPGRVTGRHGLPALAVLSSDEVSALTGIASPVSMAKAARAEAYEFEIPSLAHTDGILDALSVATGSPKHSNTARRLQRKYNRDLSPSQAMMDAEESKEGQRSKGGADRLRLQSVPDVERAVMLERRKKSNRKEVN